MTQTVTAVYENGLLRPTTPLSVPEGMTVRLRVDPSPQDDPIPAEQTAAMMRAIAAMPLEPGGDETVTARDHDRVLYGRSGS